jgi:uncharacterized protein
MNVKSERFELRLDPETLDRVDAWRDSQEDSLTRAEAVRRLVDRGLMGSTKENFALGHSERLIVWLLSELMRTSMHAGIDKDEVRLIQRALLGGHYWALPWEMSGVFHTHADSPRDVEFVVNVLDMWTFIEGAFAKLSPEEQERVKTETDRSEPKFFGFDGNNESTLMGIAQFMVQDMGRFSKFKNREFNSHMPTRGSYARMYALFEPMRKTLVGRELSADELVILLKRS